jgi:hypothetical protein
MTRICLLINQLGLGGAEKQVVLLAAGLRERGHDVTVAVLLDGGAREPALAAAGVPIVHCGFRGGRAVRANLAAYGRLVSHLRGSRPDVLHALLFNSYVGGAPAARLARVPVLVAGRPAAFEPARPAAVDTDRPVLVCVANLRPVKGHRYLLDAAAGRNWTLVLVGDGPQRPALERQAAALGVDVRFVGASDAVEEYLAAADVVVSSSLEEGLSNAVMEAMAVARPVVATAVGGTPELLADGRGVLVPPGDADALAAAIAGVLADPAAARTMADRARDWARDNLTVDTMVDRHVTLYRALLGTRAGSSRRISQRAPSGVK